MSRRLESKGLFIDQHEFDIMEAIWSKIDRSESSAEKEISFEE